MRRQEFTELGKSSNLQNAQNDAFMNCVLIVGEYAYLERPTRQIIALTGFGRLSCKSQCGDEVRTDL
ncbi:unnamed protein product [Leptosia nina]|uniref:Uncharacterized protein n=1 Tax=Leptosia nina TaxID=320188 RepID=A0AAV1JLZ8_9NEOP